MPSLVGLTRNELNRSETSRYTAHVLLKCQSCGANLTPAENGIAACVYCGATHQLPIQPERVAQPRIEEPSVEQPSVEQPSVEDSTRPVAARKRSRRHFQSFEGCLAWTAVAIAIAFPLWGAFGESWPQLWQQIEPMISPARTAPPKSPSNAVEPSATASEEEVSCEEQRSHRLHSLSRACRYEVGERCGGGRRCVDTHQQTGTHCIHRRCNGVDSVQCCRVATPTTVDKPITN